MLDDVLRPGEGALARFTRDLAAEARAGRLDPVGCRDGEISRVIDILLRRNKNNPALVGAAGVGKTAIAEGLAQRMAAGEVPLALRGARLLALDHVALVAGTMYRGQYEERLRGLVAEATADPDVILFIDELHNLIGQGTAMGVAMDAANMLKPALVRGDFRVIGATTADEYERWVRGDPALERRFQRLLVSELSAEQSLTVLESRRGALERHHNVAISDDALTASVVLTDRFITDRVRPDRALDALDEACAHVEAHAGYSAAAEALIIERRALATGRRAARAGAPRAASMPEASGVSADAQAEIPLERFAREGLAALERFGAEIEAAFTGTSAAPRRPPTAAGAPGAPAPGESASSPRSDAAGHSAAGGGSAASSPGTRARATPSERLATVERELARRLIEEGIVVRGHDVARVVSAATGERIEWRP